MDSSKSGPGVFYQVMPGVTPDGKKVMKLIPGVMVNGKFVQTPGVQGLQTGVPPQKLPPLNGSAALTSKKMVLDPPFTQQVINKVSLLNSTPSQVTAKVNNVPNKQLKYILVNQSLGALETAVPAGPVVIKAQSLPRGQNVQLQNQKYFILKQPSVPTAAVNEKSQFSGQLPVTMKSVVLPGGIPLNTEHRTSDLTSVIKNQLPALPMLPTSTKASDHSSGPSNVVSVTPTMMAKQKAAPPSLKEPIQPSYKYFPGPGLQGATKQLKLVQKAPQGHNGPCKWVIEEVDAGAPEDPPPVTPEALSDRAGRMELVKRGAVTAGPDLDSRPSRSKSRRSDAVVVCNGKVVVVANKSNESSAAHNLSKPQSEQREKAQNSSSGTPSRITEVIDLCEDDENGLSTSSHDDDNVIFVSYVPPKPGDPDLQDAEQGRKPGGSAAGSDLPVPRRRSPDRGGNDDLCGSAEVVGTRSPAEAPKRAKPSRQGVVVAEEKELAVEEEVVAEEVLEEGVVEERSTAKDIVQAEVVVEKMVVEGMVPAEVVKEKMIVEDIIPAEVKHTIGERETSRAVVSLLSSSPPTPTLGRYSDHKLRQMFQVTADVRILLQRVDDPSARLQVSSLNLCNPSRNFLLRREDQQEPSANTTARVACSHGSRDSLTCSSLPHSPPGTYEVAEAASFLQPIEEDFLSDDENQGHHGTWQPSSTTSRGGRTRKRPRCPCCIPGSGVPAAKARWSEAEPVAVRKSWKMNRQRTDKKQLDSE